MDGNSRLTPSTSHPDVRPFLSDDLTPQFSEDPQNLLASHVATLPLEVSSALDIFGPLLFMHAPALDPVRGHHRARAL